MLSQLFPTEPPPQLTKDQSMNNQSIIFQLIKFQGRSRDTMATLMEFAALQLERDGYNSRSNMVIPESYSTYRNPIIHVSTNEKLSSLIRSCNDPETGIN